ncbi:putative gag-pol polyprotein, identical, partial [Tanacetum coccineum]
MKTLFKSQDLWDLVENGFANEVQDEQRTKENKKKDSKALFFIQQAMHDSIFSRIAAAETSKEAWEILQNEFKGSTKVITVKLQTLRREFENLNMKSSESAQDYLSRVSTLVNKMKSYGDQINEEAVVSKVLRSLNSKFNHVVAAIEEAHDLSSYSFDELMSSLLTHEDRLNYAQERTEEKAFQVRGDASSKGRVESSDFRGNNRGGYRGRGRGQGRGGGRSESDERQNRNLIQCRNCNKYGHKDVDCWSKPKTGSIQCRHCNKYGHKDVDCWSKPKTGSVQCQHCKKYGHRDVDCWNKPKSEQHRANFSETSEERLFMAYSPVNAPNTENNVWYIDSGCSNHMCGARSMFKELDESQRKEVTLGNDWKMKVEGKGSVAIKTTQGNVKLLYDVEHVPSLAHNLLSVGQLMCSGHSILFDDDSCVIKDKKSGKVVANMTQNRIFPFDISTVESFDLVAGASLPKIDNIDFCEGCVYGKQSRPSFPVGNSMRGAASLDLIHANLCGPMSIDSIGGKAFDYFKKFKSYVEKQSGRNIKVLQTDMGGEFMSTEFITFCEKHGIHKELTAPYTPQQNGVAERKNHMIVEMARSMMNVKCVPKTFWAEAVTTSVYPLNISPTKAVYNRTPYEAWKGNKPKV